MSNAENEWVMVNSDLSQKTVVVAEGPIKTEGDSDDDFHHVSLVKSTSHDLPKATRLADGMIIKKPEQGAEASPSPNMKCGGAILQEDACFECRKLLMGICNICERGAQQEKESCKVVRGVCGHIIHNHCMQRRLYYCPVCAIKWQFFQYVN